MGKKAGELDLNLQTLVRYAGERYEDTVYYDAIVQYVILVGTIPANAWGRLPWSQEWASNLVKAASNRCTEAATVRDKMGEIAGTLGSVAANYAHTDIDVSLNFDNVHNPSINPIFTAIRPPGSDVTFTPGGGQLPPTYAGKGPLAIDPAGSDRLKWLTEEKMLGAQFAKPQGSTTKSPGELAADDAAQHLSNRGDPAYSGLDTFVDEFGETLTQLEYVINGKEPGHKLPLQDFINDALPALPRLILNHADLLAAVQSAYHELGGTLKSETTTLQAGWQSPGASDAYYEYESTIGTHLDELGAIGKLLSDELAKAGHTLADLRDAYAKAGGDHIKGILDRFDAYKDALKGCLDSATEPWKLLIAAVDGFTGILSTELKTKIDEAQGMLQLSGDLRNNAPDGLGSVSMDTIPFPKNDVAGNTWKQPGGWSPK